MSNSKTDNTVKFTEETTKKLIESLGFFKRELFNLRFQQVSGELTNTNRFSGVKKDIARIKTELTKRKKDEGSNA